LELGRAETISPEALEALRASQEELAQRATRMSGEEAKPKAGILFEGASSQGPPSASPGEIPPADSSLSGISQGQEARPAQVPDPKPQLKKKLKLWHKIVISLVLTAIAAASAWYFVAPRITPVKPPPAVVEVERIPFKMRLDPSARVLRGVQQKAPELTLSVPGSPITSVSFSAEGKTAVTTHGDGSWRVWDLEKGEAFLAERYPGRVRAATFAEEGRRLILLDQDSTVRIIESGSDEARAIALNAGPLARHSFSPDARRLALVPEKGPVLVLDLSSARAEAFKVEGEILALGSTSQGTLILTRLATMIRLYSCVPGLMPAVLDEWRLLVKADLSETALNEAGTRALVAGNFMGSPKVGYLALKSSKPQLLEAEDLELGPAVVAGVALDKPGLKAAILLSDGKLWLWIPADQDLRLVGKAASGARVFFSEDGRRLYASDLSGGLQVWPLEP